MFFMPQITGSLGSKRLALVIVDKNKRQERVRTLEQGPLVLKARRVFFHFLSAMMFFVQINL